MTVLIDKEQVFHTMANSASIESEPYAPKRLTTRLFPHTHSVINGTVCIALPQATFSPHKKQPDTKGGHRAFNRVR